MSSGWIRDFLHLLGYILKLSFLPFLIKKSILVSWDTVFYLWRYFIIYFFLSIVFCSLSSFFPLTPFFVCFVLHSLVFQVFLKKSGDLWILFIFKWKVIKIGLEALCVDLSIKPCILLEIFPPFQDLSDSPREELFNFLPACQFLYVIWIFTWSLVQHPAFLYAQCPCSGWNSPKSEHQFSVMAEGLCRMGIIMHSLRFFSRPSASLLFSASPHIPCVQRYWYFQFLNISRNLWCKLLILGSPSSQPQVNKETTKLLFFQVS